MHDKLGMFFNRIFNYGLQSCLFLPSESAGTNATLYHPAPNLPASSAHRSPTAVRIPPAEAFGRGIETEQ